MENEANCRVAAVWHCAGGGMGRSSIRTDIESAECDRVARRFSLSGRMLGAGDIKLFCVVGGFLGAMDLLKCMLVAVVFGAVWSFWILWKRHLWTERFGYFMQYTAMYAKERHWKSYLDGVGKAGRICFSLPILASVLCYMGGWI